MGKVKVSRTVAVLCTSAYLAECVWSYFVLRDEMIGSRQAVLVFPVAMLAVLLVLNLSKLAGRALARACGANKMNARKFGDQTWQLLIHVSMTLFELRVLAGETWYSDPASCFEGYKERKPEKPITQALYIVQLAIWVITCFSHQFLEARHKDYALMYLHHIVTIALILLSWTFHFQKTGVTVLYVHDASDIAIDLLKMSNYLKLEGASRLFIVEIMFVTNLVSWVWFRIYQLPFRIVYSCIADGFVKLFDFVCIGKPLHIVCSCYGFIWLLLALCLMHVWWLYLLLRIAYKLVCAPGKGHDAGRDEYEGDSDDDDDEHEKAD